MEKRMQKALALLVTTLMLLALCAGCGTSGNGGQPSTQPTQEATASPESQPSAQPTQTASPTASPASEASAPPADKYAPIPDKTYEISYLTMGYAQTDPNCELLQMYNKTFNVKITPVFVEPAKWDDLFNIRLASGQEPDVFPAKSSGGSAPSAVLRNYQSQGLLAELPMDTLNMYAPDMVKTINTDAPNSWVACTIDGKNYGIPFIVATYAVRHPLVWRTDWLNNVGISKIPDTIQECEDAFTKFTNDDPDKNGKKDTYGLSNTAFEAVFGAHGVLVDQWWGSYFLEKDGKIVYSAVEPGAKEALTLLAKWYKDGLIDPEFITGENKGGYWAISSDFVNGKIGCSGMGYYYHWNKPGIGSEGVNHTELLKINKDATYDFGLPPLGPDGATRGIGQDPVAGSAYYVISSACEKEPDKIGKILQMFNWPESDLKNWIYNVYGNEGKQYYIIPYNNGQLKAYKIADEESDPAVQSKDGWSQFFYEVGSNAAHETNGPYMAQADKDNMLKYGVQDWYFNLVIPSYGKYISDLNKLLVDSYVKIITGEQPVDYFDTFVSNWKANGGDQLLTEANDSYAVSKAK